jgi:hypothetical protein
VPVELCADWPCEELEDGTVWGDLWFCALACSFATGTGDEKMLGIIVEEDPSVRDGQRIWYSRDFKIEARISLLKLELYREVMHSIPPLR